VLNTYHKKVQPSFEHEHYMKLSVGIYIHLTCQLCRRELIQYLYSFSATFLCPKTPYLQAFWAVFVFGCERRKSQRTLISAFETPISFHSPLSLRQIVNEQYFGAFFALWCIFGANRIFTVHLRKQHNKKAPRIAFDAGSLCPSLIQFRCRPSG